MTRSDIIKELKKYFSIGELVCPHTLKRYGEGGWRFFDTDTLHMLLVLRTKIFNAPITINDGKNFTQRGNRCNCCAIVKAKTVPYMSGHVLCRAFDMDVRGYTAKQARDKIKASASLLPCNVRLEDDVTWLHIDTVAYDQSTRVTTFKA